MGPWMKRRFGTQWIVLDKNSQIIALVSSERLADVIMASLFGCFSELRNYPVDKWVGESSKPKCVYLYAAKGALPVHLVFADSCVEADRMLFSKLGDNLEAFEALMQYGFGMQEEGGVFTISE